jgi:TRAP-type C4-dicarboxylate transport system permease small subunit
MTETTPAETPPRQLGPAAVAFDVFTLWLKRALEAAVVLLVLSFFIVVLTSVFYRYVLNDSIVWTEEWVRFTLFWTVMLGTALVSYENGHLYIEAIHHAVPKPVSIAIAWLAHLLSIAFLAILLWQGIILFSKSNAFSPAMHFPMRWVYAAMIFGSAFTIIFIIRAWVFGREAKAEELV